MRMRMMSMVRSLHVLSRDARGPASLVWETGPVEWSQLSRPNPDTQELLDHTAAESACPCLMALRAAISAARWVACWVVAT